MKLKPKDFFLQAKKETPEEKKNNRNEFLRAEAAIVITSFALPFLMALLYCLVGNRSVQSVFTYAYRFAILGGMLLFALNAVLVYYFWGHRSSRDFTKEVVVVCIAIALTYILSTVFSAFISIFIAPICLVGLVVAMLIDRKLALYVNIVATVIFYFTYSAIHGELQLMTILSAIITQVIGGCFVILIGKKTYTRMSYFLHSLFIGVFVSFPVAFLTGLIVPGFDVVVALKSGLWAFVSMLFGLAFFMIILPAFEFFFSMYSNFRLDELCSPEAELMSRLAKEAPGTYNHSLAMANLAQACAMAIGENPTLARAGACYHDVGKLRNPICFTENQTNYNPHDDFIPEVSVSYITRHTHDGAEMIRKAGLPEELARIAEEHHGKQTVGFFLNKTRGFTDEQLMSSDFSYSGPKPSTKISGLIMIVDTIEAATRSQGIDKDERNFKAFIHKLIMDKMDSGQFSECPLTLKDLQVIEDTLVKTLPSLYHQRIKYSK